MPSPVACHSQSGSLDEAIDSIGEAIKVYLESVEARGEPILQKDLSIKLVEVAV